MDLDMLTIPPELFYPKKNKADYFKYKAPLNISPKLSKASPRIRRKVLRKKRNEGPRLGRINNQFLRAVKAKKRLNKRMLKKEVNPMKKVPLNKYESNLENKVPKTQYIPSQSSIKSSELVKHIISTSLIKPSLIRVPQKIYEKQIKQQEKKQRQTLYVEEDFEPNRMSGGSFKFFKTKNSRPDDEDFGDTFNSFEIVRNEETEVNDFEDDKESEFISDNANIESLLEQLDGEEPTQDSTQNCSEPRVLQTLDGVIDILQNVGIQKIASPISTVVGNVTSKPTKFLGIGTKQLQLDAGQKKFGIVDCKDCGLHYNTNVPEDELVHEKHHQDMLQIPRFKGWAKEKAMQISGLDESSRVIHLEPGHKNLDSQYITEILHNMTTELGVLLHDHQKYHIYLAVYASKVVGICAAEESITAVKAGIVKQVRVGIQRLYVRPAFRRKGMAKAILTTIQLTHFKGLILENDDIAFSTPTSDGTKFVQNITKTTDFYMY